MSATADKMARLREKLAAATTQQSGFWSPEEGKKNIIRILPEAHTMEFFFQPVGKHYLPDKSSVYCPHVTTEGAIACSICDYVKRISRSGTAQQKKQVSDLRVRRSFWMNVLVRGQENLGPQIYTPGQLVFTAISNYISDPDYEEIYDPQQGFDVVITREGSGLDTTYNTLVKPNRTPVIAVKGNKTELDEEAYEILINACEDLSVVVLSDDPDEDEELRAGHAIYVLPEERFASEYSIESIMSGDDEDDADDVIPPQSAVQRRIAERAGGRQPRR